VHAAIPRASVGIIVLAFVVTTCSTSSDTPDPSHLPTAEPTISTVQPTPTTASPTPSAETTTFHSDASGGFTVDHPATWSEVQPASAFVVALFLAPVSAIENGFQPNVNIVLEPLNVTLTSDEYATAAIGPLAGTFKDFEEIGRGPPP
jgi:hypothetical protein